MSDGIGSVSVTVVPDARGFPEKLRAQLAAALRDMKVKVHVDAETAEADRELEDTNLLVDRLDGRKAKVKVDVDKSSIDEAESALSGIGSKLSGLGGVGLAAGALGPALIPVVGGLVGVLAALAGPLAAATGGIGLFTGAVALMVAETTKAVKSGGPLTPLQKQLVGIGHELKSAFDAFTKTNAPALMKPLVDLAGILVKALGGLSPIISAVSGAIDGVVRGFGRWADSAGFKSVVGWFASESAKAIPLIAQAIGNLAQGFGRLFGALTPTGNNLLKGFVDLTGKFAHGDMSGFVKALERDIPATVQFVGDLFKVAADTVTSLAPFGEKVLGVVDGILKALDKVPQAAGAVGAALTVGAIGAFFGAPEAGLGAGAFVGLVAAFKQLYDHIKPLRGLLRDIGDYFTKTWLPRIEGAAQQIGPAFSAAFRDISRTIRQNRGFLEEFGKALVVLTSAAVIGGILTIAGGIRATGKAFAFAVGTTREWAQLTITSIRIVIRGLEGMVRGAETAFGTIIDGATSAFGWLPKIGPKIKTADAAFHSFADNAVNNLQSADDALGRLQDRINAVGNSHPSFKVIAQTQDAINSLERLQAMRIGDKSFTVTQIERTVGPGGGIGIHKASGGYISGPGGPRDDKIPALLSNGEFVVNAAATAQHRALLESINAQKFAGGGFAGSGTGFLADQVHAVNERLKDLAKTIQKTTDELTKEQQKRASLIQAETSLAQSVSSAFRSDLFTAPSSPWAKMVSPDSILRGDIHNAQAFNKALHSLSKKGLDGGAFSALASSGNLQAAQMLAGESRKQVLLYERLYNERQRLTAGVGRYAGDHVFGQRIDDQTTTLHHIRDRLHDLNATERRVEKELKHLRAEQAKHAHAIAQAPNKAAATAQRRRRP